MVNTGEVKITWTGAQKELEKPRALFEAERLSIKSWYHKKELELETSRGDPYVAQRNQAAQVAIYHNKLLEAVAQSTADLQKLLSGQGVRFQDLHEQIRLDVTHEASEIHKRHNNNDEALRKLLDYHEKEPPSNPGDLDLMAKVLSTFKVQRMNQILKNIS